MSNNSDYSEAISVLTLTAGKGPDNSDFDKKKQRSIGHSVKSTIKNCVLTLFAFIGFYLFLGYVIHYFQEKRAEAANINTNLIVRDVSTCSANSFLLADGVCDDLTNNQACFFDRGDCCLENKDTKYCSDCLCKRSDNGGTDVHMDYFENSTSLHAMYEFDWGLYFALLIFPLVDDIRTCHELCSERDAGNGWIFDSRHLTCQCIHMDNNAFCVTKGENESTVQKFLFLNQTSASPIHNCNASQNLLIGMRDNTTDFRMVSTDYSSKSSRKCQGSFSKIVSNLTSPTVALVDTDTIAFCGGFSVEEAVSPNCYFVKGNDVVEEVSMVVGVVDSAGIRLPDAIYLTGGIDEKKVANYFIGGPRDPKYVVLHELHSYIFFSPRKLTQYISTNGEDNGWGQKWGPDMPFPISSHCFERVTLDVAIIIGGSLASQEDNNLALLFNITSKQWTLETMIQSGPTRTHHSCGVVQVEGTKKMIVVVAGGRTPDMSKLSTLHSHSTELLITPESGQVIGSFIQGPDCPVQDNIHNAEIAVSYDRHSLFLAAVLFEDTVIFEFHFTGHFQWVHLHELSFRIPPKIQDHNDFFALIIPKANDIDCFADNDDDEDNQNSTLPQRLIEQKGLIWRQIGDDLYYFHSSHDIQTWDAAFDFCSKLNSSLPEIRTIDQNTRLAIQSRAFGFGSIWLGVIEDPILKKFVYLSDQKEVNKSFQSLVNPWQDCQTATTLDTSAGVWRLRFRDDINNVACQSGIGGINYYSDISKKTADFFSNINDTCCDLVAVERMSFFLSDVYHFIFGRFRRTRRECGRSWSYTKVGVYEHYISSRYHMSTEHLKIPSEPRPYFPNPPGYRASNCFVSGNIPSFTGCLEEEALSWRFGQGSSGQVCNSPTYYFENVFCSPHETEYGKYHMLRSRRYYHVLETSITCSWPYVKPWGPKPFCNSDTSFEAHNTHFEPEKQEDMLDILALVRNTWFDVGAFWLGFVFDEQLRNYVHTSNGRAINFDNFAPEVKGLITFLSNDEIFVYVNVTDGFWYLSHKDKPKYVICVATNNTFF